MKAEDVKNGGVYRVVSIPITSEDDERYIMYKPDLSTNLTFADVVEDEHAFDSELPDGTIVRVEDTKAGTKLHIELTCRILFGDEDDAYELTGDGLCYVLATNLHPLTND